MRTKYIILKRFITIVVSKILPVANPSFDNNIDSIEQWLVEFDENGIPQREIGLCKNKPIMKMPWKENYGYWTDSHLLLKDFKEKFSASEIEKDFFEKSWAQIGQEEESLFFHEDDFRQVEIIPIENLVDVKIQSEKINEFVLENLDGSEIYIRSDNKIKLSNRKINPEEPEEIIKIIGLPKAPKVFTGYGTSYREICPDTIGYGKDYTAIYFDVKNDFVEHIWLTNEVLMDKEKLSECLYQLGIKWRLLLINWPQTHAVDLSDKEKINRYLNG